MTPLNECPTCQRKLGALHAPGCRIRGEVLQPDLGRELVIAGTLPDGRKAEVYRRGPYDILLKLGDVWVERTGGMALLRDGGTVIVPTAAGRLVIPARLQSEDWQRIPTLDGEPICPEGYPYERWKTAADKAAARQAEAYARVAAAEAGMTPGVSHGAGGQDRGVWQMTSPVDNWPAHEALTDPVANARAAADAMRRKR